MSKELFLFVSKTCYKSVGCWLGCKVNKRASLILSYLFIHQQTKKNPVVGDLQEFSHQSAKKHHGTCGTKKGSRRIVFIGTDCGASSQTVNRTAKYNIVPWKPILGQVLFFYEISFELNNKSTLFWTCGFTECSGKHVYAIFLLIKQT